MLILLLYCMHIFLMNMYNSGIMDARFKNLTKIENSDNWYSLNFIQNFDKKENN